MKSEQGFTLVEVLISCVVLCLIMVGFVSFMYQQAHHGLSAADRQSYVQMQNGIQSSVRSIDTVTATNDSQINPDLPEDNTPSVFDPNNTAD